MNISKHTLIKEGLNYAGNLDKIPNEDFIVATVVAALELIKKDPDHDPKAVNAPGMDVVDVLSNLSPETEH